MWLAAHIDDSNCWPNWEQFWSCFLTYTKYSAVAIIFQTWEENNSVVFIFLSFTFVLLFICPCEKLAFQ